MKKLKQNNPLNKRVAVKSCVRMCLCICLSSKNILIRIRFLYGFNFPKEETQIRKYNTVSLQQ